MLDLVHTTIFGVRKPTTKTQQHKKKNYSDFSIKKFCLISRIETRFKNIDEVSTEYGTSAREY